MPVIASPHVLAYLAPELPALSATFVYEELLGLERRGYVVLPISIRRPAAPAVEQLALAERTQCVYEGSGAGIVLAGLLGLPAFGTRTLKALGWLFADMAEIGWLRHQSWKLAFQLLAAVKLARLLWRHRCVHLHVHFAHVPAQIAMYASAFTGIPFTVTGHANDLFERGLLLPSKAARAKKFLTVSEHNCAYLKGVGIGADRLAVVRCGVSPVGPAKQTIQSKDRYRLGTLGRLVEKKGMDVLIRAIGELRDKPYALELTIAGDGPLRDELEALARQLELGGTIRFEGNIAHSEVARWMGGLDAFVLACKRDVRGDMDGIPVVLMEAMSCAVPVVSTRLSGIPELVVHEKTGLLAVAGDPRDLAAQIDRLLLSSDLREVLVRQALAHVESEFSRDINLDRLLGHFAVGSARAA